MPPGCRAAGTAGLLLSTLCGLLAGTPAHAEPLAATRGEDLHARIVEIDGQAAILTRGALYRFQPEAEAWTLLSEENGIPDPPLQRITLTEEELWIGGAGTSFTIATGNDWQRYGPGEGYPGRVVFGIEADADYAYAATDNGAARFDRYVLEWEPLPGTEHQPLGRATDVAVGEDRVWFALRGAVAEFRKETESIRRLALPGDLQAAPILALHQSASFLWAITPGGLARYDKSLETWTAYLPGIDLPDARIHQATLRGEDLWLGTDEGLWRYRADRGIWRRDEAGDQMPGHQVHAFSLERGLWVATEQAFAGYDERGERWIDFTAQVPASPGAPVEIAWVGETLLLARPDRIVYAQSHGGSNPYLFTYRMHPIREVVETDVSEEPRWQVRLDEAGLGAHRSSREFLVVKGGATLYVEDDDAGKQPGESDLANLIHDTRVDLTLNGRMLGNRALNGHYDTTDPENESYLLSYRGARDDLLRTASAGELDARFYNSRLAPGAGLEGGWLRAEYGPRSAATRRRLLTTDVWAGERRTFSGHKTFYRPQTIYRLDHRHLTPGSERIEIDGEQLTVNVDYTIDWRQGSFIFADHVLLDEEAAVDVAYEYEVENDSDAFVGTPPDRQFLAAQAGVAPWDPLFLGLGGLTWRDEAQRRVRQGDLNARLEWGGGESFLRLMPGISVSDHQADPATAGDQGVDARPGTQDAGAESDGHGMATALAVNARHQGLQLTASHRRLDAGFSSLEDRQTLIGRLREDARVEARLDLHQSIQATLDWNRTSADQVAVSGTAGADTTACGHGEESLIKAGLRWRPQGLPSLGFSHARVAVDSLDLRREKRITRGELEYAPAPGSIGLLGIRRLWLQAFVQRSHREATVARDSTGNGAPGGESDSTDTKTRERITDQIFLRFNGSAGQPLSWNLDWEERWTHQPQAQGPRGLRRIQELDATLQSQPHQVVDVLIGWQAQRDLAWKDAGGTDGFSVDRQYIATAHLYPGRLLELFRPLTMRIDINGLGSETGDSGEAQPGGGSLWRPTDASAQRKSRNRAIESRLQLLSWLRWIDRLERERSTTRDEGIDEEGQRDYFENRIEIRPRGGLLILRYAFDDRSTEDLLESATLSTRETRRISSEWNQTWGGGFLTYLTFEMRRTQDHHPLPLHRWSPQVRGTYRTPWWRIDATLGLTYTYEELFVARAGAGEVRGEQRSLGVSTILGLQPLSILTIKLQLQTTWPRARRPDHDIDLRLTIRA